MEELSLKYIVRKPKEITILPTDKTTMRTIILNLNLDIPYFSFLDLKLYL